MYQIVNGDGPLFRKMKMCGQKSSLSDKLERIYAGVLKAAGHETAVQWVFLIGAFEERQRFLSSGYPAAGCTFFWMA